MQWHRGWHRRKWFCLGTTSSIKHIPHLPHGLSGLLEVKSFKWSLTCVWRKQSVMKCNDKTDIPQATAKLLHAELRASFLLLKKGTLLRKCKPRLWAWQVSYEIWNFLPESTLSWKNSARITIQTIRIQAPGSSLMLAKYDLEAWSEPGECLSSEQCCSLEQALEIWHKSLPKKPQMTPRFGTKIGIGA